MITDIFAKRYADVLEFDLEQADKIIGPTLVQARRIFDDIQPVLRFPDSFFRDINQRLARELGVTSLKEMPFYVMNEIEICSTFLSKPFDTGRQWFGGPDYYCKTRLSMLELLFREAEAQLRKGYMPAPLGRLTVDGAKVRTTMKEAIQELNVRLRDNRTGLVYNNGFLHRADDQLTAHRIAKPFWEIVVDPKWATVDQEMKEAFDHFDHGQRDACAHAAMALESTIKIISDEKAWTRGNETGAASYIDNLVKDRGGRFIEVWEKDALIALFRELRNPQHHGAGSNTPPRLLDAQQTWAIESCMSWIKSLVRRNP
jgi:hypothetical protein